MNAMMKVVQARSNLLLDEPFFGVLALRLRLLTDPMLDRPKQQRTMWTDGKTIGFNAEFVESLTMIELQSVIMHEVLHCANGHIWRRGNRDLEAWNYWADAVINPIVIDAGGRLPKGCVNEPHAKGKSVEEVYREPKKNKGCMQGPGGGMGCGEVRDTPNPGDAKAEEQEWKQATLQAAQAAMARGHLPAGLEKLIDSIKHPAIDWKAALRKFVEQALNDDYSWSRPNKRYLSMGMYMPCMRSDRLPPVVIGVDTSASVDDDLLKQFAGEMTAIMSEARPQKVIVMYCDAKVHKIEEYEPGEPLVMKVIGRGGTDFRPVLEAVAALDERVACLIYLTDGYGEFGEPIDTPTLWAMNTDVEAPFGETLRIQ